jgi:hypothetical protein
MPLFHNKEKLEVVNQRSPLSTPEEVSAAHNLSDYTRLDDELFYARRKGGMILPASETNNILPVTQFSETNNTSSDANALPLQPEKIEEQTTESSVWKILSKKVLHGDLLLLSRTDDESNVPSFPEPSLLERRLRTRRRVERAFRKGMHFSLWHCFVAIFIYILIAVLASSVILDKDWTIIDSCYFAVVGYVTPILYI